MEILSKWTSVIHTRSAAAPCCSSFRGEKLRRKESWTSESQPRRKRLAVVADGGLSAAAAESLAQLQLGLKHHLTTVDFSALPSAQESAAWWATPLACWYLSAKPGTIGGLVDYASKPLHSHSFKSFNPEDVEVGRMIGQGSFGVVYDGYIGRGHKKGSQGAELHVILKKVKPGTRGAEEMHAIEEYMNRRVKRTTPKACAEYLGTTAVSRAQAHGRLTEGLWLVWKYEGGRTLDYYLKHKDFPENLQDYVLSSKEVEKLDSSKSGNLEKRVAVTRRIMSHILMNLRDLHRTGLVHRDVKPLNLILAEDEGIFKLIDLGACVDVRSGRNYEPEETVIDPIYAAPEHHVMPTSTPKLPPEPVCSLVSPLVWALNTPDRFDVYSAGLVLLQMAVKPLRQDMNLYSFNADLKRAGYNLDKWRKSCRYDKEEFELLDANGGAGWDLVKTMVQPRHDKDFAFWPSIGSSRPSAEAALKHRFFSAVPLKMPSLRKPVVPHGSPDVQKRRTVKPATPVAQPSPVPQHSAERGFLTFPHAFPTVHDLPVRMPSFKKHAAVSSQESKKGRTKGSETPAAQPATVAGRSAEPHILANMLPAHDFSVRIPSLKKHAAVSSSNISAESKKNRTAKPAAPAARPGSSARNSVGQGLLALSSKVAAALKSLKPQITSHSSSIIPALAVPLVALGGGALMFSGVWSSAEASYSFGSWAAESMGVSGLAFATFFYVVKPWLESQTLDDKAAPHNVVSDLTGDPSVGQNATTDSMSSVLATLRHDLVNRPRQTGLSEVVMDLERQLASLEASITVEQEFAEEQNERLIKVEKLLLSKDPSLLFSNENESLQDKTPATRG